MGLFSKKRTGTVQKLENGRRFEWEIPNISTYSLGSSLDSPLATHFQGARFHFRLYFASNDSIGFYMHFTPSPIPKYSYYLQNSKKEMMRQQTAHTIPRGADRLGHSNVCSRTDLHEFIGDGPDVLVIVLIFDDDVLETLDRLEPPRSIITEAVRTGSIQYFKLSDPSEGATHGGDDDSLIGGVPESTQIIWTIPSFKKKCLWPFTSHSFGIGSSSLIARIDVRRRSTSGCIAVNDYDDIESFIFFIFSRQGEIPSHAIELVNGPHPPASNDAYALVPPKPSGTAQGLLVDRNVLDDFFSSTSPQKTKKGDDEIYVCFTFIKDENPLNQLSPTAHNYQTPVKSESANIPRAPNGVQIKEQDAMDKKFVILEQ